MCEPQRLHYFKVPRTGARRYLSPTPVGVGVATWAVDQTLSRLPRESGYARLGKYIGSTSSPSPFRSRMRVHGIRSGSRGRGSKKRILFSSGGSTLVQQILGVVKQEQCTVEK